MRYLLFNLVVFAALAYLITGDGADPQSWFEDRLQNLNPGAWFEQQRDAPQNVATPAPTIAPQPVDTIAEKTEAISTPVHEAPIPAPVVTEAVPPVAEPRDTAAPAYEAPVIAEAPASTEQPAFMTRSERRRELNHLIQDMEGQFLDRLGN